MQDTLELYTILFKLNAICNIPKGIHMNNRFVYRYLFFLLIITSSSNRTFAAPEKPLTAHQVTSLAVLGKTWGFFKYYHPKVAKGQYNWDSVLIAKVPVFLSAKNTQELNDIMLNWLNDLGQVDKCDTCDNSLSNRIYWNLDTAWIANSGFKPDVISKLQFILANRNQGKNHYVTYGPSKQVRVINESRYYGAAFEFPSPEYRLLTLFRYWNIVNYFSPYKYITSKKWEKVLHEFIPSFYEAKDTLQYHVTIRKLVGALEDGHSSFTLSPQLLQFFGAYCRLPFLCTIVEGKAVVTMILNDSLCKKQGVALNEVITTIDGETIEERINKRLQYVQNASNGDYALNSLCDLLLFAGKTSTCEISRLKLNGDTEKLTLERNYFFLQIPENEPPAPATWKMLPGNIGYIYMGELLRKDVNAVMDSLFNTKGIIFDLRNYPRDTWPLIAARLCSHKFLMGRLAMPDLSYPGTYKYRDLSAGAENTNPYKGKVILLVNASSKSHSEMSAIGLQAATKTITIGSTTAGSNGDITEWIEMGGAFKTRFSGLGLYYPDGTVAQKNGVKIDIVCRPTIKGIQAGKDELLEKAVQVINGK
jgi:carboxyl-terminal processing protease